MVGIGVRGIFCDADWCKIVYLVVGSGVRGIFVGGVRCIFGGGVSGIFGDEVWSKGHIWWRELG